MIAPGVMGTPDANRNSRLSAPPGVTPGVVTAVVAVSESCATTGVDVAAPWTEAMTTVPSAPDLCPKSQVDGSDPPAIFHHILTWCRFAPALNESSNCQVAPPPAGVAMSVRSPTSAVWWASSRSPATRVGAVAVIVAVRSPVCVTARTDGGVPVDTDGEGIVAVAATTAGVAVALLGAVVVGAGTDAVAATTAGEAVEPVLVVGVGTAVVAATTDGVAVASVPPAGLISAAAQFQLREPLPLKFRVTADPDETVLAALWTAMPDISPIVSHANPVSDEVGEPVSRESDAMPTAREPAMLEV